MAINNFYILGALGTIGAVGSGIYFIYPSRIPKTQSSIRDKLIEKKYSIMKSSDEHWNTILTKYKDNNVLTNKKFSDLTGIITEQSLKKKCEDTMSSRDFSLYEKARLWCTVPRTIQQRLQDLNISVLKTGEDDEDTGDKSKWINLEEKYRTSGNNKIKNLTLSQQKDSNSWQSLRNECKNRINKERWDEDYEYYLEKVTEWCTLTTSALSNS